MTTRTRTNNAAALRRRDVDRARLRRAAALWGWMALGGIVVLTAFVLWHLARRGRMVRDRLGQPRDVRLPNLPPTGRIQAPEAGPDR